MWSGLWVRPPPAAPSCKKLSARRAAPLSVYVRSLPLTAVEVLVDGGLLSCRHLFPSCWLLRTPLLTQLSAQKALYQADSAVPLRARARLLRCYPPLEECNPPAEAATGRPVTSSATMRKRAWVLFTAGLRCAVVLSTSPGGMIYQDTWLH